MASEAATTEDTQTAGRETNAIGVHGERPVELLVRLGPPAPQIEEAAHRDEDPTGEQHGLAPRQHHGAHRGQEDPNPYGAPAEQSNEPPEGPHPPKPRGGSSERCEFANGSDHAVHVVLRHAPVDAELARLKPDVHVEVGGTQHDSRLVPSIAQCPHHVEAPHPRHHFVEHDHGRVQVVVAVEGIKASKPLSPVTSCRHVPEPRSSRRMSS